MTLSALLGASLAVVGLTAAVSAVVGRAAGWIAAAALAGLAVVVGMMGPAIAAGDVVRESIPWLPTIDVAVRLRLDGLALVFLLIVLGIGALVMAYSARYLSSRDVHRHTGYFVWMTLFAFAMTGLVLADDIVLLFVFWELTTLCSFFLINRSGRKASAPAVRTLIVTAIGGLILLLAVALMVARTGTTVLHEIVAAEAWSADPAFTALVAVLVAIAALTKSAQFPFHYWLPDAMVAPTPVSAYLHAAAMVKAGIYLLLVMSPAFAGNAAWQAVLMTSGLVTALLGGYLALRAVDLKQIMAYSTVGQLGFIVATIGVGTPGALAAAVLFTLSHALFKAALFMVVGIIDQQAGTRDIRLLRGLSRRMRTTLVITVLAGLSMAGVIPLLGFIAKEYVLGALLDAGPAPVVGIIATLAASLAAVATVAYTGRILLGAFTDDASDDAPEHPDRHRVPPFIEEAPIAFWVPAAIPAVLGLVLGLAIPLLRPLLGAAAGAAAGEFYTATFALYSGPTVELALSLSILSAGVIAIVARRRLAPLIARPLLPVTAIDIVEGLRRGIVAVGARAGRFGATDAHAPHLALPWVLLGVLAVVGIWAAPSAGAVVDATEPWTDALLLALTAITVLPALAARSRLVAVILIGGAGFVVALWFFALGAIDVGLTQLLVELLTVVALVLFLRRLPALFHRVRRSRTAITATIAVVAGLLATIATLALTGRRDLSPAGQAFLERAYVDTGGTNIVNTILVDYRALDTFGELTVVAVAGIVLSAVLAARRLQPERTPEVGARGATALGRATDNTLPVRVVARWAAPVVIALSAYLFLRGHYEPGGGFIAALVGGTGFALAYLGAASDTSAPVRWPYRRLFAAGVVIAALSGLWGLAAGSFLKPVRFDIPLPWGGEYGFTSALVFDLGVYLAVVAIVIALLNEVGGVLGRRADDREEVRA
ncbi:MAG: cation:proton antiporter [Micrococcales bacterium 32-70-13]|nr:MAG: cation:proton antiporter [Micrococcales bacterium 32-70-13]